MKKTILIKTAYLLDVDEDILKDPFRARNFEQAVTQTMAEDKAFGNAHTARWEYLHHLVLDPDTMNCGRCAKCGAWTTDSNRIDRIRELAQGAREGEALLCDCCLP